jgi:hypothetical protein
MQPGDTVQIRQFDSGENWIYATVLSPYPNGGAFVMIDHPGNLEHSTHRSIEPRNLRVQADVIKLREDARTISDPVKRRQMVDHFDIQAERLTPAGGSAAPATSALVTHSRTATEK